MGRWLELAKTLQAEHESMKKDDAKMTTHTPLAGKALRKVNELLETHFDEADGIFKNGFSDDKIAKETGISLNAIREYRISAFGKLKPPSEFHLIQQQLNELETLYLQTEQQMKNGLKDLKAVMANMKRKFD